MQLKFLHAADIHLGYQQYGLDERYDDFVDAFRWVIDTALNERVDFLLLAGDLFEKRTLDPRTLLIAVTEFERLKAAGTPVVAIEGNHERTYGDSLSWMEYLSQSDLLYLLDCSRHEHKWTPQPWDKEERTGGYVDLAGARVYGLRYQGAQTGAALRGIGAALAAAPRPDAEFSILLSHTSVEGYYDQGHPFARQQDLSALRHCVDYLALGHVHVPYRGTYGEGEWLYNPGCPETWSSEEWQYREKGAILAEVDTGRTPDCKATFLNYPHRRPFIRIRQELDACPSPSALLQLLKEKIAREPVPGVAAEATLQGLKDTGERAGKPVTGKPPVVEVVLTGVARFARTEIDTAAIEQLAKKHFDPLVVRFRSSLQEAPTSLLDDGDTPNREVLERLVFENLIRADDRFAASAADMAQLAISLKQMVLDGVPAGEIAEEAGRRLREPPAAAQDGGNLLKRGDVQSGSAKAEELSDHATRAHVPPAGVDEGAADGGQLAHHVQQDNLFGAAVTPKEASKTAD